MSCTCQNGGFHDPANYECDHPKGEEGMSKKTFHIQFGSNANPIAHGEGFYERRKDAERVRRWWVDSRSPERRPGDRWAVIRKLA